MKKQDRHRHSNQHLNVNDQREQQQPAIVRDLLRAGLPKMCGNADATCAGEALRVTRTEFTEGQWRGIVALASAHLVLPALHFGLPGDRIDGQSGSDCSGGDGRSFLEQIARNNASRNAGLRDLLMTLGSALNAIGVEPLVLKGGAFLAADTGGMEVSARSGGRAFAPWRFMSDLDLLVPRSGLLHCVAGLCAAGFTCTETDFDMQADAHYPPLISPCGHYAVELHHRLFRRDATLLCPDTLFADAQVALLNPARLLLPSREHRIAHLIAHAQLQNGFYESKRIVLRDVLDLSMLMLDDTQGVNWSAVLLNFASPRDKHAARAFIAAWQNLLLPDDGRAPLAASPVQDVIFTQADNAWAAKAVTRLDWSQWQRGIAAVGQAGFTDIKRLVQDSGDRHRLVRQLRDPRRLGASLIKRASKLRQSLWA